MAPEMNEDIIPKSTVMPQTREVIPVPSVVSPKIVPRQDPNPMKPPSMQKNATKRITKFLF